MHPKRHEGTCVYFNKERTIYLDLRSRMDKLPKEGNRLDSVFKQSQNVTKKHKTVYQWSS